MLKKLVTLSMVAIDVGKRHYSYQQSQKDKILKKKHESFTQKIELTGYKSFDLSFV